MNRNPTANHQLLSLPSGCGVFMADNIARVSVDNNIERFSMRTAFGLITCWWKFFQQVIKHYNLKVLQVFCINLRVKARRFLLATQFLLEQVAGLIYLK